MRYTRLFVAMLLATATLTAVACSTSGNDMSGSAVTGGEPAPAEPGQGGEEPSGGEQPGGGAEEPAGGSTGSEPGSGAKPGEPINPSGGSTGGAQGAQGSQGYASPEDYLNSLSPTQRVDWAGIEDACGANAQCTEAVANFETHLQTICPQKAGCTDSVANLLYNTRSASMVSSGTFPATFPQAKDVLAALTAMDAGSSGGDEPVAPAGVEEIVAEVTTALAADSDGTVTWEDIVAEFAKAGDTGAVSDAIAEALKNVPAGASYAETAEALTKGEEVSTTDAATVIAELAMEIEG